MTSPANHARDTLIAALQADATAVTFVPADRQYPNRAPTGATKPYSRLGVVDAEAERLSGWRGANIDGAIHIYASAGDEIPDPESWLHDAADAFAAVIDELPFAFHDRTLVMPDKDERDEWHGIVYYRFDAVEQL